MIALDTSILARYILNDSPLERDAAEGLMSRNDCCVGWTVLVELCWVLESNARLSRNEVAESLSIIASSDFIVVPDDTALKWAIERYSRGADFADMIHLVSALNGSVEFACFDRKLARQAGPRTPIPITTVRP